MHKLKIELSRFTVVGAINFVFTFVLFFIMVKALGLHHLVSLVAVSLLGMVLTYSLNFVWTFKPERQLVFRGRLFKYIAAGTLSLLLNALVLEWIVRRTRFDPYWVQVALLPLVVVFNFSTAKFWSLKAPGTHEPRAASAGSREIVL